MEPPYNCYLRVKNGYDNNGEEIIEEYQWSNNDLDSAFSEFWEKI